MEAPPIPGITGSVFLANSVPFVDAFRTRMNINPEQIIPTFPRTGNAAPATLPLQLAHATNHRRLAVDDTVGLFGLFGLASGASAAVVLLRW
ncbi:3-oxoacyl-[acyl-carrier-protein] synthase III C-terminal domain-containing protein [Streptomyces sp. MS1.HAVA.3]|uniref:3-oxoacyl-[acyl-carrier-protein] synthase III C-terminal domain-containing protein n=1 Tax=Streptomyces caledonius TaxID=3134107 RepID=A0ABU8UE45_9ACTN